MDDSSRSSRSTSFVLPLFAVACSVISVLLLLSSGFGTRLGLWHFRTGFSLLKFAAYCGLGCALLSIASGVIALRQRRVAAALLALVALALAIASFGVPYSWKLKAQQYPRIHDITTDTDHPPQFVTIPLLRGGPIVYPGAAVAVQQIRAYPDLKTVVLPMPPDRAFPAALETAKEMGWEIVAAVQMEGRIEATDTTPWFGFKDDIVIRLVPAAERTLLDVRSVSRVGISDLGTNAARIRTFVGKMSHQAK